VVTFALLPQGWPACRISSPAISKDPASWAAALLLVDTWNDIVTETIYQAELAGLNSHISVEGDGLEVIVAGFNDKLPALVGSIFQVSSIRKLNDDKRLAIGVLKAML
jgi:secreted Zn-dependent insulinase-like peptidase